MELELNTQLSIGDTMVVEGRGTLSQETLEMLVMISRQVNFI